MTGGVLVDSNVLLDVLEEDATWYEWSAKELQRAADSSLLVINKVIYAEVSIGFQRSIAVPYLGRQRFWRGSVSCATASWGERGDLLCPTFLSARMRQSKS